MGSFLVPDLFEMYVVPLCNSERLGPSFLFSKKNNVNNSLEG